MNDLFTLSFFVLAKYNMRASLLCLGSLAVFYLPLDDLWVNAVSCVLMGTGAFVLKGFTMRLLFFVGCGLNLLSVLSNYYSGLHIEQLHDSAYLIYLVFSPLAITINLLIITDIVRTSFDRITSDIALFCGIPGRWNRAIFNLEDAKSAKKA